MIDIDPSRRQFLFGGAMIAASAAAYAGRPHAQPPVISPGGLEKVIPPVIGQWTQAPLSGLVVPPRDETEARIYDQVLTRVYVSEQGPPIMLLIAFGAGQTGLFEIHRPDSCYPAQGFAMSNRQEVPIPIARDRTIPTIFWSATSDVRTEQVLYWARIGRFFPVDWAQTQMAIVRSNLNGLLPDGVLVRISSISPSPTETLPHLTGFAQALLRSISPTGHRVLLGSN